MNYLICKLAERTAIYFRKLFSISLLSANSLNLCFIPFIIIFFGITPGLRAQYEVANKLLLDDVRFTKIMDGSFLGKSMKISDVQGTPYLNEKFEAGKIITMEDSMFQNLDLRYNAFTDDLEFKQGENIFNVAYKTMVKKAEFGGKFFSYRSFEAEGGNVRDGFFEILTEGKATLLARYKIKFLDKVDSQAFVDAKPAQFEDVEKQFFIMIEGSAAKLIPNKKGLLRFFGDKSKELETFISKNGLSVKDDESLIKIVTHYNSL